MPLLDVRGLSRGFYGIRALDGVDLAVEAGTITGLIGPNGAGKTTLFNCVSGLIPPEDGRVLFAGHDVTGWRADRVTVLGAFLVVFFMEATRFATGWLPGLKPVQVAAVREMLIGASLLAVLRFRPTGLLPERIQRIEAAS